MILLKKHFLALVIVFWTILYSSKVIIQYDQIVQYETSIYRILFSRLFAEWLSFIVLCIGVIKFRVVSGRLRSFLNDYISHPINLAIFRIVVFIAIFFSFNQHVLISNLALNPDIRILPPGTSWIPMLIPLEEEIGFIVTQIFFIACWAGLFGVFTRLSTLTACLSGLYVMYIPEIFGKVFHYHFLWWYLVILAASRCGDALSVDVILRKARKVRHRFNPSASYGMPLRYAMLTLGLFYFFGGYWKWMNTGIDWVTGDAVRHIMIAKWTEGGGLNLPFFRIDHYPLIYQTGAAAGLMFELGFIFLIFFSKTRWLAFLGGLGFHNANNLFLHIAFWPLQMCYVMFVDWYKLAKSTAKLLSRKLIEVSEAEQEKPPKPTLWLIHTSSIFLCAGIIVTGAFQIHSWPFACSPFTARYGAAPSFRLEAIVELNNGKLLEVPEKSLRGAIHASAFADILFNIYHGVEQKWLERKLKGLYQQMAINDPRLAEAHSVSFILVVLEVPDNFPPLKVVERRQLLSWELGQPKKKLTNQLDN